MRRRADITIMAALTLLIGLMIAQALAYGIAFTLDPAGNVGELGYTAPAPVDGLTVALVRLLGIAMISGSILLALGATLMWRGEAAGSAIAIVVGGTYVAVGVAAATGEQWWDAGFYGATGATLIVLAAAAHRLGARSRSTGPDPGDG